MDRWMASQSKEEGEHYYLSTACLHGQHESCRRACEWCTTCCLCKCHQVRDIIILSANTQFPREACGFILNSEQAVVTCTNVAEDPYSSFRIGPAEAERWWSTGQVVGVWHSHSGGPAVPSEKDEELAVPGIESWIYSVPDEDLAVYLPDEQGRLQLVRFDEGGAP